MFLFKMKKNQIMGLFSIFAGLFVGGCSQTFEVLKLKNKEIEPFFEEYNIYSPKMEKYRFGNVLLSAYFTRNPSSGYDLRLSVWSETKDEKVTVVSSSILPLKENSSLDVYIVADQKHIDSGLFLGHKVLIAQISGDRLSEFGNRGSQIEVNVSGKKGNEVRTFTYFFTVTKQRVAAPLH